MTDRAHTSRNACIVRLLTRGPPNTMHIILLYLYRSVCVLGRCNHQSTRTYARRE